MAKPREREHQLLDQLDRLSISSTLKSLPSPGSSCEELDVLDQDMFIDWSDQHLKDIPETNQDVTHLRLDNNLLTHLSKLNEINHFRTLTVLDLSNNHLTDFEPSLTSLTNLKELYLGHNHITTLPGTLGSLLNLEILDVSYNCLTRITNKIYKLTNLHHLDVRYNQLPQLPYSLGVLESRLFTLMVDHNPFNPDFLELVKPLLMDDLINPEQGKSNSTRWKRFRTKMRKSISLDPQPSAQAKSSAPVVPTKNPRRMARSTHSTGTLERSGFDNRRCQTLDGVVFISDSQPSSPSSPNRTSLKKLGYSQLMDPELDGSVHSRPSRNSVVTNSSSGSSNHGNMASQNEVRDSGYSTDQPKLPPTPGYAPDLRSDAMVSPGISSLDEPWPSMQVGAHHLPSHAKLMEFLRVLRDYWDLSHESSEAALVAQHRRQVKSLLASDQLNPFHINGKHLEMPCPDGSLDPMQVKRRQNILAEIVSTEQTYVTSLQQLIDIYITSSTHQQLFTVEESRVLFGNVQSILLFHKSYLLPEIVNTVTNDPSPLIGKVFKQLSHYLKMYSLYINNFDVANHEADKLMALMVKDTAKGMLIDKLGPLSPLNKGKRKIKQFLDQCLANPEHTQLNLQGYLLLPVQRIPRYKMLLHDLLRFTPQDHADRNDLAEAYRDIATRAEEVNERKRLKEMNDKVLEIQNLIKGNSSVPLVEPHRRFIKEGKLMLHHLTSLRHRTMLNDSVPAFAQSTNHTSINSNHPSPLLRHVPVNSLFQYFLFNDIMIQCRMSPSGLELHRVLELGSKRQPARLVHANKLRVVDNHTVYYFEGETDTLISWATAINSR